MKTCPKCGYDKLADTARFCHKCGCDCAAVQVERTSAAEEPEAAPLVGDKNLINESTIIGKQEKYEASNITIHNNITEDHSHTTIVCAVSGKRIYLDHSVVCPKCGKQVALEYYVEASKRCENCEQQAREEYRAFVVRTTGAGPLDAACKQQLDAEAQRLQIDAATQASILRARQQKPAGKSAELTSVQRAELEAAVSRLITATEPEPAQKSLEALTVLHENSSNYEADYWYFLARAVVCPEESVKAYEEELTDDYWQRFWGFLGYCNTGSPKGGAAVDRLRSVFGQREDDIRLAEAIYYLARGFDAFETSMLGRAGELASSVRREYLSKPLVPVYDTLQRLVRENIRLEEKYTPMETFVFVDVFRAGKYIEYLCAEQARKEQEAREAEARREQEAREAEAKLERERQAAEQALRRDVGRPLQTHGAGDGAPGRCETRGDATGGFESLCGLRDGRAGDEEAELGKDDPDRGGMPDRTNRAAVPDSGSRIAAIEAGLRLWLRTRRGFLFPGDGLGLRTSGAGRCGRRK